ncbi:50S ribosomal protein L10 [Candidatus Micrarchaeota archaeon CG1_02_47_40]|nr:MAG: 50S ribosomal protein L10 [Candidatus Micrarchaeota archaeon CG1_02_47_40]
MARKKEEKKERRAIAKKKRQVEALAKKIASAKVLGLVDLKKIPDRFLQKARKGLRGNVEFVVAKNSVLSRAIEKAGKGQGLLSKLKNPSALLLSSLSPYALSQYFRKNRGKVAAKPGQAANEDIKVEAGETNLPPGPALTELKGANINAQIKGGKIVIAKDSVVAKKGEKIPAAVCKALQKLGILPFETGVEMAGASDEEGIVFDREHLKIDEAEIRSGIINAIMQANNVSINSGYPTEQTVGIMLSNALSQARNMALNGDIYSESVADILLQKAVREANALGKMTGAAVAKKEEKKAEDAQKEEKKE